MTNSVEMNERVCGQVRGTTRRAFVAGALAGMAALFAYAAMPGSVFAETAADDKKAEGDAGKDGEAGVKTVTDCAGREVEVPTDVKTCVAIHPFATQIAYRLVGTDGLLAVDNVFTKVYLPENATPYYTEEEYKAFNALPVTTVWMKGADEEQLLSLAPDVIFTLTADTNADQLQKDLGIPVVCLYKSPASSVPQSFIVAGEVLNKQELAQSMADWWQSTEDRIAADIKDIAEEDRPRVMYVGKSGDIMAVPGKDTVYGSVINESGCVSVSDEVEDSTNESVDVTMEQMLLWNPDAIVCQTSDERETIMASEEWSALEAVKNGEVYVPLQYCGFDGWFSVLGTDWLNATVVHEGDEEYHKQLIDDMRDYYEIFYGRTLTDEELEQEATTW